ncbi:MAG: histidine phosphatase family protein [Dehalococcoidia bacterium]
MRLILVRHGQTDWNTEYRAQGQSDVPLNDAGEAQAEAVARALRENPVSAIFSSPLSRAYRTAQAIRRFHEVDITADERLQELDLGDFDGRYYPSLETDAAEFFRLWNTDPPSARWPGGETLPELQRRVWEAVRDIISCNYPGSVVLTSHFFSLLTLLCRILELSLFEFRRLNLSVGSISLVELTGEKGKLLSLNDTCHLD